MYILLIRNKFEYSKTEENSYSGSIKNIDEFKNEFYYQAIMKFIEYLMLTFP